MKRCNIVVTSRASNPGVGAPWGAVETIATCATHNMPVDPVGLGELCPIGRIEEATEIALKKIADASTPF